MRLTPALAPLLLLAACAGSPASQDDTDLADTDGAALDTDSGGSADTDVASDTDAGTCEPGSFGGGEALVHVGVVQAHVVDTSAAALASVPVSVRGVDLSFDRTTDAGGDITVTANHDLKRPMFAFGDALHTVRLAVPLDATSADLGTLTTARLPDAGVAIANGVDLTSGDLTVRLDAGAVVSIDTLSYDTPDSQQLRAVTLPVDREAAVLGPDADFEILVGLSPAGTVVCPRATLTVPNTPGWPSGARVEFWTLGQDVGQQWAPYGSWQKISEGAVSADGLTVSTDAVGGVPVLDTFAVRRKP